MSLGDQTTLASRLPDVPDVAVDGVEPPDRRRWWQLSRWPVPSAVTAIALIAAVFFVLGSIGSPLLGKTVFAATDELSGVSPYYDSGLAGTVVQNTYLDDTYTAELPAEQLFSDSVKAGHPASWNPYNSGGEALGSSPNDALLSPLTLPFYVLPTWLAPAYEKLLETFVAILGCFLFLRRIRIRRAAAIVGGTIFASSAFMVVWMNFPQTRTAAFIPWVFWAVERLVQRRRITDAVLLALPVGFMLLGGFPAVTGFALLTGGAYLLVRAIVEHRGVLRRQIGIILGAGAALLAGIGLAALQLLPFAAFYSHWLIEGRAQTGKDHLTLTDLATSFAPWTFGGVSGAKTDQPFFYLSRNLVESMSYLGAAALVLVVVAVSLAGAGRRLTPRGVWVFLVAATGSWLVLIYLGGPLGLLQHFPVFSTNFIGRARSVLGFLLAMVAAIGFELLLQRRAQHAELGRSWRDLLRSRKLRGGAVWVAAGGVLIVVVWKAYHAASKAGALQFRTHGVHTVSYAVEQLLIGLAFAALAVGAAALLYWAPRSADRRWRITRFGAAALLPILIAVQALTLTVPYYPRVAKDTFYPTTDVQTYLADNLGQQRFAGTWTAMVMGADTGAKLRAVTGHTFVDTNFAALVRGIPDNPIPYPTYINFYADPKQVSSPVLDQLATRYFVTSPRDQVFGTPHRALGDGGTTQAAPSTTFSTPVPTSGPLRAVGFTLAKGYPQAADPQSWVSVVIKDGTGATVTSARRLTAQMYVGKPFLIPVAADKVPAGTKLSATFTMHTKAPLTLAANSSVIPVGSSSAAQGVNPPSLAISSVSGRNDGLSLAYAGSSVIYERLTAMPRIRWASQSIVQPDQQARVKLLASGSLNADQVVLNAPGAPADGKPATVHVDDDGTDSITSTVAAQGAGYLVVADADQIGWVASVDGRSVPLVKANEGVVAVPVNAGTHKVTLRYVAPVHNAGTWITVATILLLIGAAGFDQWLLRRRRVGDHAA